MRALAGIEEGGECQAGREAALEVRRPFRFTCTKKVFV
jgi:hypothetical protein